MQAYSPVSSRSLFMATDQSSESAHPSPSPEQRFLDYARTGNKAIIQSLIVEFADRSYNQARRIIGRNDGAEDAMQDAYLRLVHGAKKYDGSVPFAAWLGRLVSLAALNHRERRRSRHTNFSDMSDQGAVAMNKQMSTPDNTNSADQPELEALRTALDSLPDRYRTPMTLHYFGGLDHHETAAALGIPARTIETQLGRGLERLREKLFRAGFAVTSAGLLTVFASLPTYAAPPAFKASLAAAASERFVAAARHVSHRLLGAKKGSSLATGAGLFKAAVVGALLVAATVTTVTLPRPSDSVPVAVAAPTVTVNPEYGLVGHWKLDETSGSIAADSSGNRSNGTLGDFSTPGWTMGKVAGALNFDGASGIVAVGSPIALTDLGRMTIAAWIMPRSYGQPVIDEGKGIRMNYGRIVDKRDNDVEQFPAGWSLFIRNDATPDVSGVLCFRRTFDIEEGSWITPVNSVVLGAWQHVAVTYDIGSLANQPAFYLDGTPVPTTVLFAPSGSVVSDVGSKLSIGNLPHLGRAFDGVIDDVRIYDRILSASEIQVLATGNSTSSN
jgi:RNA polymerase sigma factor (sigma-70 family)